MVESSLSVVYLMYCTSRGCLLCLYVCFGFHLACLSQSLNVIAECYSHLLSSLPNISGHLAFAVSSHLTDIDPSHPLTLDRYVQVIDSCYVGLQGNKN